MTTSSERGYETERVDDPDVDGPAIERAVANDEKTTISIAPDLELTTATRADWKYFKRWHYLGDSIGPVFDAYILWDGDIPVAFASYSPTSLQMKARSEAFGKAFSASVVNKWFAFASRLVIDPRYRGAGIASTFFREATRRHAKRERTKYVEVKTSMGAVNHFAQAAGFQYIGSSSQLDNKKELVGGGAIGGKVQKQDVSERIRKVYLYIMDTEDEFDDVDLDYESSEKRRRRRRRSRGDDS